MTVPSAPTPSDKAQSLALLERIAAATEANAGAIRALAEELAALRVERDGRGEAASAPAANGAQYREFRAEQIVVTIDEEGQPAYRVKGHPYVKFGVRVWPEVLPALGLDPAALKPGPNPFAATVRVVMNGDGKPKKVVGLAA